MGNLGHFWVTFGAIRDTFGKFWAILGTLEAILGTVEESWGTFGPIWGTVEDIWGTFVGNLWHCGLAILARAGNRSHDKVSARPKIYRVFLDIKRFFETLQSRAFTYM